MMRGRVSRRSSDVQSHIAAIERCVATDRQPQALRPRRRGLARCGPRAGGRFRQFVVLKSV